MDLASQIERMTEALTVKRLAALLACSEQSLYKMASVGTIPHYKIASGIRFDPAQTAVWLRSRRRGRWIQ